MKNFSGQVLFLDRNDINTDEIIPAKYLTENTKNALKPHILEDLHLEGFDSQKDISGKSAIELPKEDIESIFSLGPHATVKVDLEHNLISAENEQGKSLSLAFSMNDFDRDLVMAGGWLAYADNKY